MMQTEGQDRSALDELASRCSASWPHLASARQGTRRARAAIAELLAQERLVPADAALVVFGSLARGEWTNRSDLDWTLLVDGPADQAHAAVIGAITRHLKRLGYHDPGLFGGLLSSHDLVHRIGGEHDAGRNLTRMLLLLESEAIGTDAGESVHERVIRQMLRRYVEEEPGDREPDETPWIPRFLLSDVVRFWRTMAVDTAARRREGDGAGWALRDFKLQMSRKLVFAAGLAACVSCTLRPSEPLRSAASASDEAFGAAVTRHLLEVVRKPPIEILARTVLAFGAFDAGRAIYDAYDAFLALLGDADRRLHLAALAVEDARADPLFREARRIGRAFEDGLAALFFGTDPALTRATQRYGVF